MGVILERLLLITAVYGVIVLVSPKGEVGNIVRFACAVGMLAFLANTVTNTVFEDLSQLINVDIVKESADDGKEMFEAQLNEEIADYVEKDIKNICIRYGMKGDVNIKSVIGDDMAKIERIELKGDFKSSQGAGFIVNEIKNIYHVEEVIIVENKY